MAQGLHRRLTDCDCGGSTWAGLSPSTTAIIITYAALVPTSGSCRGPTKARPMGGCRQRFAAPLPAPFRTSGLHCRAREGVGGCSEAARERGKHERLHAAQAYARALAATARSIQGGLRAEDRPSRLFNSMDAPTSSSGPTHPGPGCRRRRSGGRLPRGRGRPAGRRAAARSAGGRHRWPRPLPARARPAGCSLKQRRDVHRVCQRVCPSPPAALSG